MVDYPSLALRCIQVWTNPRTLNPICHVLVNLKSPCCQIWTLISSFCHVLDCYVYMSSFHSSKGFVLFFNHLLGIHKQAWGHRWCKCCASTNWLEWMIGTTPSWANTWRNGRKTRNVNYPKLIHGHANAFQWRSNPKIQTSLMTRISKQV